MKTLLSVESIHAHYGKSHVLQGVSLQVQEGELVTLLGRNGAGKTTTLNAIAGVLPIAGGDIHYKGERINALPAHRRLRAGIALVPEGRGIFTRLTVEENLRMGAYSRSDKTAIAGDLEQVYQRFTRLAERRKQTAGTLSGGEQQLLAMGRAILSKPRLLLLDEPTMGLAPIMVDKIFEVIADVSQQGVTVLLIEQNARLALEVAQRGYVLESGALTLDGPANALLHDPKVRAAYLGE